MDGVRDMLFDVADPVADVVERRLVAHVIHQQYSHRASVVSCSDRSETLLTGSIPNLQLYALALHFYGPDLEVNPDGGDEASCELVLRKS